MAEASIPTVKLPDDITVCPICSSSLNDPRSLPCIHNYCLNCLNVLCRDKKPGEKSQCPACGTDFSIPGTGPNGLPQNMLIERILNMRQLSSGENTRILCDYCSSDEESQETQTGATKYCVQCQEKLCDLCAKTHRKSKLLRSHTLIDLDDTKALDDEAHRTSLLTVCEKHCDQTLTAYCDDCNLSICVTCLHVSHKDHATSLLKDVTEKFQQQMSSDISRLDDGFSKLREMLISVEQQKEDFI
jgi:tripartite motif-containing protein 2/3